MSLFRYVNIILDITFYGIGNIIRLPCIDWFVGEFMIEIENINKSSPERRAVWGCSGSSAWARWCSWSLGRSGSPDAGLVWARLGRLSWRHSHSSGGEQRDTAGGTLVWEPGQ